MNKLCTFKLCLQNKSSWTNTFSPSSFGKCDWLTEKLLQPFNTFCYCYWRTDSMFSVAVWSILAELTVVRCVRSEANWRATFQFATFCERSAKFYFVVNAERSWSTHTANGNWRARGCIRCDVDVGVTISHEPLCLIRHILKEWFVSRMRPHDAGEQFW